MHLKFCAALLLIAPAVFASNVELKIQLQSCQQISDEEQRLSCFDQIVSRLESEPQDQATTAVVRAGVTSAAIVATEVSPSIQQAQSISAAVPQQEMTAKFGLKKPNPEEAIEEISSVVTAVTLDLRKKLLITLENGQQWRQIDQEYLNIKAGQRCVVKRGAIGSFLLGVEGAKKKIRVRRVE